MRITIINYSDILEMIDGYSSFTSDKMDIVNTETGKSLKKIHLLNCMMLSLILLGMSGFLKL